MSKSPLHGFEKPFIDPKWRLDAKRTALDALNVLDVIVSKMQPGIPTVVLGNMRYGKYFVVDPIGPHLKNNGVAVKDIYLRSRAYDGNSNRETRLSNDLVEIINSDKPHIFFVDGTGDTRRNDLTRFPASVHGIINAFESLNDSSSEVKYELNFWSQMLTPEFFVGNLKYVPKPKPNAEVLRSLTVINAVQNSYAFFDDPENKYPRPIDTPVLTKTGFNVVPLKIGKEVLVPVWQRLVDEEIRQLRPN